MLQCLLGDGEGVEVSVKTGSSEEEGWEEVTTSDDVTDDEKDDCSDEEDETSEVKTGVDVDPST